MLMTTRAREETEEEDALTSSSQYELQPLSLDQDLETVNTSNLNEVLRFVQVSLPNSIVMCTMYMQMTLTLSTVASQLGTREMSGISLGSLTANLTSLTIVYGLLTAVDILAPQSFGAGNLHEVGVLVMRGLFLVFAITLPLTTIVWLNAEQLLLLLGQPAWESKLAGEFLQIHLLSLPALVFFESSRRFLWSQEVSQWPIVLVCLAALGCHALFLYVLVPAWGFSGAAFSHVFTNWTMFLSTLGWISLGKPHDARTSAEMWNWPSVWGEKASLCLFLKLALSGVLTMSEWVFFEAFIAMTGLLGEKELAASSIAYNLIPMMFALVPSGVSIAMTARIGALLAQSEVARAKRLTRAVFALALGTSTVICLAVYLLQDEIIGMFSSRDEQVRDMAKTIWPFVTIFIILDCLFGIQSGLLRALGLQDKFSVLVWLCLFVLGLPLIYALSFGLQLGVYGMWLGLPILYAVLNLALFVLHSTRDWDEYSAYVVERELSLKQRRMSNASEDVAI